MALRMRLISCKSAVINAANQLGMPIGFNRVQEYEYVRNISVIELFLARVQLGVLLYDIRWCVSYVMEEAPSWCSVHHYEPRTIVHHGVGIEPTLG